MEDPCHGTNFDIQLIQIFYAVDGDEAGKPIYIHARIKVEGGQTHDWIVKPKDLKPSKLQKEFRRFN